MKIIEILLSSFRKQSIKANWKRPVVFPFALSTLFLTGLLYYEKKQNVFKTRIYT